MKHRWVFISLLILFIFCLPLYATADMIDEEKIVTVQHELDEDNSNLSNEVRVESIAQRFEMDATVVRDLRESGQGWGEINIELSMANYLHNIDPDTYMTKYDALDRISALRDEGRGWGEIAQSLGFKLGPVISSVKSGKYVEPEAQIPKIKPNVTSSKPCKPRSTRVKNKTRTRARIRSRIRVARGGADHARIRPIRPHRPVRLGR